MNLAVINSRRGLCQPIGIRRRLTADQIAVTAVGLRGGWGSLVASFRTFRSNSNSHSDSNSNGNSNGNSNSNGNGNNNRNGGEGRRSSSKVTIYRSKSSNPFVNLSIENFLMQKHKNETNHNVLYLWRNGPSVIMGKHQSVWRECRVHKMEEDKVYLVRRPSGGGAVYQDYGNSIFTFICDRGFNDFSNEAFIGRNNQIVIGALRSIGVTGVEATGRNDLQFDGKKVSGAAFRHTKETSLHHGTLLLDVNMGALANYLTPNKAKMESKGVTSVAARVMNLKEYKVDIDHAKVSDALIREFLQTYVNSDQDRAKISVVDIDESIVEREPIVKATMDQLMNKDWRFGKDPKFSHKMENRFAWGSIEINIDVQGSVIKEAVVFSDALDVLFIDLLPKSFVGNDYHKVGINKSFELLTEDMCKVKALTEDQRTMINECRDWVIANIVN